MRTRATRPRRLALSVFEDHMRTYDIEVLDNTYFLIAQGCEAGELVMELRVPMKARAAGRAPASLCKEPLEAAAAMVGMMRNVLRHRGQDEAPREGGPAV